MYRQCVKKKNVKKLRNGNKIENYEPIIQCIFLFQKLGYVAIWTLLYIISSIISFVTFQLNAILVYILLALFVMDLFFHYRVYKTGSGPDATASNPTATAASGGEVPKYWSGYSGLTEPCGGCQMGKLALSICIYAKKSTQWNWWKIIFILFDNFL